MEMYIGQLGLENEYLQTEVRKIQMSNRSQTELIQLMRKRQGASSSSSSTSASASPTASRSGVRD